MDGKVWCSTVAVFLLCCAVLCCSNFSILLGPYIPRGVRRAQQFYLRLGVCVCVCVLSSDVGWHSISSGTIQSRLSMTQALFRTPKTGEEHEDVLLGLHHLRLVDMV